MSKPKILEMQGEVLFKNEEGEVGDITLNDTKDNYKIVEIFYKRRSPSSENARPAKSVKVELNNDYINLSMAFLAGEILQIAQETISLIDTSLKRGRSDMVGFNKQGLVQYEENCKYFLITKVVGYK